MMHAHDLTLQDKNGNTAFCLAVVAGALEIIEILMQRDRNIATIRGGQGATPLYMAALFGNGAIASRLYPITKDILPEGELHGLFFTCIHFGLFGKFMNIATISTYVIFKSIIIIIII